MAQAMQALSGTSGADPFELEKFTKKKDLNQLLQLSEKYFANGDLDRVRVNLEGIAYMLSKTSLIQGNDRLSQTGKKVLLTAAGMAFKACQLVYKDSIDCDAGSWVESRADVEKVRAIADSLESMNDWKKRFSQLKTLIAEFQEMANTLQSERFHIIYKDN